MELLRKRIISLLLVLTMLFGMMPTTVLASENDAPEGESWEGKSAVFVGDSITAGSNTTKIYYQYLEEALGFDSVTAMGVAGSCISAASDYGQKNQPLIDRYQSIPSADLMIFFMGTNDYGHETPLGCIEDEQDGSFYGALNTIIPALAAKHSSSKIVFVTPIHRYGFGISKILGTPFTSDNVSNGVGATLGDYVDALKIVCANNGVSVIDLYTECTLNPEDADVRSNYMPDGLHPNVAGHELIAEIMEAHIRGYVPVDDVPEIEVEPEEKTELVYGNKFASGFAQHNRASSRVNQYLKAGTVITLKNPTVFQWACARPSDENSCSNLGYFPDGGWSDQETATVAEDGWVGFVFKYRDETQSFDLTKPLSDYIIIEDPHVHAYETIVTSPTCSEQGCFTHTCSCGDSYVDNYVDATGEHIYENRICIVCGEAASSLQGKTLSILGASISTFAGTSNGTAADTTNSTIRNNVKYYPNTTIPEVELTDTWWMQAADDLGLCLLVNNSWSGSSLLYERNGTVGAYVDRCIQLHDDTGENEGEEPDIIAIQMGTNDFQYYKDTLGTSDINYESLIKNNEDGTYTYAEPVTSLEAAAIVLHKISIRYPKAEVYYLNISQRVDGTDELIREFNAELAKVCEHFDASVVDIYGSAITMEGFNKYIGDGRVHPNKFGMDAYTEAFKRSLIENTDYLTDTHTVSFELEGVTADYGDNKIVVRGDSFRVNLTANAEDRLNVTVTMGGKDITESSYKDGSVQIASVTDDVTITAKAQKREPLNFRWEFDGTNLVSISEEGFSANVLTKNSGTTENGVFNKVKYSLEKDVLLLHDRPWTVEWKSEGTWKNTSGSGGRLFTTTDVNAEYNARYIFKSAANYLIAMGEKTTTGSHNYGVALSEHGIDGSQLHTYRLENRISEDGTNMIYLHVDGKEIGAMNHYYIGTNDQGTTSDWLSGKDFVFPYIGTDTHGLTNCSIEYVEIWESGEEESEEKPSIEDFKGKTISILGDSISTYEGISNNASYNSSLADGAVYFTPGKLGVYQKDTWWQQTIDALDMKLLVNNSWSGSSVLHTRSGTEGAYVNRCLQLHNDYTGEEPDVIMVFMGTNDFSYYQSTLGDANIDYDSLIIENSDDTYIYAEPNTTCEAYAIMLHKIHQRYPESIINCILLTSRRSPDKEDNYADVGQPTQFNSELEKVIGYFGDTAINLEDCGIEENAEIFDEYMGDGRVHPNIKGMDQIAEYVISVLLDKEITICDVNYQLFGVRSDNNYGSVLYGNKYNTKLRADNGDIEVTVIMDGKDVTDSCYFEGTITIENVTGDITIIATERKTPADYYWRFNGEELISVGTSDNKLLLQNGTIANGILQNVYFKLDKTIVLRHDLPWTVEFKISGKWSGMILSNMNNSSTSGNYYLFKTTSDSGFIGFGERISGQYMNHGVALIAQGIDTTEKHVYCLKNCILEDGSNMVYLSVDDVDYGAMNHYFIGGSSDQGTTSDWISGKDLVFSYIGASGHTMNNCSIDYIKVNECEHSYKNNICINCGKECSNIENYQGKIISVLGDSISTFAGYIPTADGFNLEHLARYPQDNLLTDVKETWWMQVIDQLDAKLGINDSWRGATVSGAAPVTSGTTGENAAMSNLTRIQNLGSNGTPDVILFYGGTNDIAHVSKVGSFDSNTTPSEVDLSSKKWDNLADGYVHTLLRLKHYYPEAMIVAVLPNYTTSYYSNTKLDQANDVLIDICEHYGIAYVDLRDSGITIGDLPDGIHPDAAGMDYITDAVVQTLLEEGNMEKGAHIVYSVKHELEEANAGKGYYKGISAGEAFEETITGNNVIVNVTMGGIDITSSVYVDGKVYIPEVTGDLVIRAQGEKEPVYAAHLQQLPKEVCSGTNLWTELEHDKEYYAANGWDIHSSGKVYSVTIPVKLGDRIWATSFQKSGTNGGTINGIRVTWFDEFDVIESMGADKVYKELDTNGYLTAPEGAVAVSVPMWNNSVDNELYVLSKEHNYTAEVALPTCTEQGYTTHTCACGNSYVDSYVENLGHSFTNYISNNDALPGKDGTKTAKCDRCEATDTVADVGSAAAYDVFKGKVISILGASTCTFAGYIPEDDGFNIKHHARYPQDNLLTDVNDTWWMQIINGLDAKLGINDSWRGTKVYNSYTGKVNSSFEGTKASLSSLTRIQNLGSNGTPDIIFFFGGINDIIQRSPLEEFNPVTAPKEADLTSITWDSVTDAYTAAIMRLQHYYPNSQIVVLLPNYSTKYSDATLEEYMNVYEEICAHYGVLCLDTRESGCDTAYMPDGIHPNAEGMTLLADYVSNALLQIGNKISSENNEVCKITHKLVNVTASKSYFKGISKGNAFEEELAADEEMAVTVKMNDVDITESCYADGKIFIEHINDDIEIIASAKYSFGGRLQEIPDNVCCDTNIWKVLTPVNEYYTVNGWGNNAAGSAWSVTVPVNVGDKLWATSFGKAGENGFTANGVRLTWFEEQGVLESVDRDRIYNEFSKYGYLTVPEGAIAVNIVMSESCEKPEFFILNLEHNYGAWSQVTAPTCTEEGYTLHRCSACYYSCITDATDALGHDFAEYISDQNATRYEDGTRTARCERENCDVTDTIIDSGTRKILERIVIESLPEKTLYIADKEELDITGGSIRLHYTNAESEVIPMTEEMVSGYDFSRRGSQELIISFEGMTTSYMVNVISAINDLKSLYINGFNLQPGFASSCLEYEVNVPYDVERVDIRAEGAEYTKVYVDNSELTAGKSTDVAITVTAENGNEKKYTIHVFREAIPEARFAVKPVASQVYTGSKIQPEPVVYDGVRTLVKGKDYTLSYKNNVNAGTATVIVKGKGKYKKTQSLEFSITPRNIAEKSFTYVCKDKIFTGKVLTSNPVVKWNKKTLKLGKDYTVSFSGDQISAGKVKVIVAGIGNYTGTAETSFRITEKNVSKVAYDKISVQSYSGKEIKPKVVLYNDKTDQKQKKPLTEGKDYTVSYENNVYIGTGKIIVTGQGSFEGSKIIKFKIQKKNLNSADVDVRILTDSSQLIYTGNSLTPDVEVHYGDKVLRKGIDYTVKYSNNKDASFKKQASIIITGKGNYSGQKKTSFVILPKDILSKSITFEIKDVVFNAKKAQSKNGLTAKVIVKDGIKTLKSGTHYKIVGYENNRSCGDSNSSKPPMVILQGYGCYRGTIKVPFRICQK